MCYVRRLKVRALICFKTQSVNGVTLAKVLSQIEPSNPPVPVQLLIQSKPKDQPSDALPNFVNVYKTHHKIGMVTKEKFTGKLVTEWEKQLKDQDIKVDIVDAAPCISSFMAVKNEEELVSLVTRAFRLRLIVTTIEMYANGRKFELDIIHESCSS